jgi:hypothetical protein
MLSVERGIEKLENLEVEPEPSGLKRLFTSLTKLCKEFFFKVKIFVIRQNERNLEEGMRTIILQNLERENIQNAMEIQSDIIEDENEVRVRGEKRTKNLKVLKRIFSLRYLC